MGYATITGVIGEGRYSIQIDAGSALRTGLRNAVSAKLLKLESKLLLAQAKVLEAEAVEADAQAQLDALADIYASDLQAYHASGGTQPSTAPMNLVRQYLTSLFAKHAPLRITRDALRFELGETQRQFVRIDAVVPVLNRSAWCVDYTVDKAPGSLVATIDIPGDSNLVLIAAGCRAPNNDDGFLIARSLLAPHQAYFNAAIFPGWQKWLPTFRRGTITAINDDEDRTVNVSLFNQTSSAQRLAVNQTSTLSNVLVEYMACGSSVFEVDDNVVVQFIDQDWAQPRVIGFVTDPRPCNWICVHVQLAGSGNGGQTIFQSLNPALMSAIVGASSVFECRLNGGSWQSMSMTTPGGTKSGEFSFDDGLSSPDLQPAGHIFITADPNPNTDPEAVGFGLPAHVMVYVGPSAPFPPQRSFEERNVVEARIRVAGETVFNAATLDCGWAGEGFASAYVKSPGGIHRTSYPNLGDGFPILPLEYTLTGG